MTYLSCKRHLESLTNAEIVNMTADLLSSDTLQYIVAREDFDKMILYSEMAEVHLFVKNNLVSVDEIEIPRLQDELLVLEYCKRYGITCICR